MKFKLVDVSKYGFAVEPRYFFYGWANYPKILIRESIAEQLKKARKELPLKYHFKIWDGYRTLKTQSLMLNSFYRRIKAAHPDWKDRKIIKELCKFGSKPIKVVKELDTHRNGGSLDLTIVDNKRNELYMGTDHDDLTPRAALDYFETKRKLTPLDYIARKNRKLLKKVMLHAGFQPYPPEWWHWSYGK